MEFYDQLSRYYDYIFPARAQTTEFLAGQFGNPPQKLLDVACGTGGYSLALAEKGYAVTGVDLSEQMIARAREKAGENFRVEFLQGDMRELEGIEGKYDGAFCLGNSFVHLLTREDMHAALNAISGKLRSRGKLIIQTVNYDWVLKFHVKQLPAIENKEAGIVFERYYDFREDRLIDFHTVLKVPEGTFTNTVTLRPLLVGQLRNLLLEADFVVRQVYGSFDGNSHDAEAQATIVVATKR